MFKLAIPAWDVVLRTAAVYAAVLIGLRLAGKREMGQAVSCPLAPRPATSAGRSST